MPRSTCGLHRQLLEQSSCGPPSCGKFFPFRCCTVHARPPHLASLWPFQGSNLDHQPFWLIITLFRSFVIGRGAQWLKTRATKPDNLGSIPRTHVVERDYFSSFPLTLVHVPGHVYTFIHACFFFNDLLICIPVIVSPVHMYSHCAHDWPVEVRRGCWVPGLEFWTAGSCYGGVENQTQTFCKSSARS